MEHKTIEQKLYSSKQAAEYLGFSDNVLRQYRLNGSGPIFVKRGKRIFYERVDLDNWIGSLSKYQSIAEYKEEMLTGAK